MICETNSLDTCGCWFNVNNLIDLINKKEKNLNNKRHSALQNFFCRQFAKSTTASRAYKHKRSFCGIPTQQKVYYQLSEEVRNLLDNKKEIDDKIWDIEFKNLQNFFKTETNGISATYTALSSRWERLREGAFDYYDMMPGNLYKKINHTLSTDYINLRKAAIVALQNGIKEVFVSA